MLLYRTKEKKICKRISFFVICKRLIQHKTGLDAAKSAYEEAVLKK